MLLHHFLYVDLKCYGFESQLILNDFDSAAIAGVDQFCEPSVLRLGERGRGRGREGEGERGREGGRGRGEGREGGRGRKLFTIKIIIVASCFNYLSQH